MNINIAKADAEALLNSILPFARKMLSECQEFFPYGGCMDLTGKIIHEGASDGTERPLSKPLIDLLNDAHRKQAQEGKLRTCAVIYDIRATPPGKNEKQDAIAAAIDHISGYSVVVIFPYSFDENKNLIVELPYAVKGEGSVFSV